MFEFKGREFSSEDKEMAEMMEADMGRGVEEENIKIELDVESPKGMESLDEFKKGLGGHDQFTEHYPEESKGGQTEAVIFSQKISKAMVPENELSGANKELAGITKTIIFEIESAADFLARNHDVKEDKIIKELVMKINDSAKHYSALPTSETFQRIGKYIENKAKQAGGVNSIKSKSVDIFKRVMKELKYDYDNPLQRASKEEIEDFVEGSFKSDKSH